jgi:outer membrane protein OmpA-like peptidoglycan-associated protein
MNGTRLSIIAAAVAAVSAGCASMPERVETLEVARTIVNSAEQDPLAREAAAQDLAQARNAISAADTAIEAKEDDDVIAHRAYLANRYARIAEQRIAEAQAREEIQRSEAELSRTQLQAREREAERARVLAEQREVTAAAEAARAETEAARADTAEQRAADLESELQDLQARETNRGLVLTLGDVLFETDEANLQPGAAATMDRLADFMNEYPDRNVLIEGHTDARGSETYNIGLSERRARAVREAMVDRGIATERIQVRGLGESYPVASNESSSGMQQNRRVEIVISDEEGDFPRAAERTAVLRN